MSAKNIEAKEMWEQLYLSLGEVEEYWKQRVGGLLRRDI